MKTFLHLAAISELELPGVGNLLFVVEVNVEENELEKPLEIFANIFDQ